MDPICRPGFKGTLTAPGPRLATRNVGVLAAILLSAAPAAAETRSLVSTLNGHQAAVASPGFGCARFIIDTDANALHYHIAFGGMLGVEAIAHIHGPAAPGALGPVMVFLPLGNPKVGTWNYPEVAEPTLLNGLAYIAIHSSVFPADSGELRGQIVDFVAVLDEVQVNPPSGSGGRGYGLFTIDTCANELTYTIVIEALDGTETAAALHGYALHTDSGGSVHPLPLGPVKTGVWPYPEAQEQRILDGQLYVDIHSTRFEDGEIRGQVVRAVAPVDGTQEVPATGVPGHGCAEFAIDRAADTLSYYLAYGDLTGPATGVHIHGYAPPGMEGGVQHVISAGNPVAGQWSYPAASEADILGGLTYVNIHTAANSGGEIRGQAILPLPPCPADLDCDGGVGAADLALLLGAWGPNPDHGADFNDDGAVNAGDLAILLGGWGPCP